MASEYTYEPTDLEDELFLSEVPLDLIQNSIESQFNDPLEYRKKDYIQSFITKYDFSKDNMLEDDLPSLDLYHDTFIDFIEKIFEKYLGIGFVDIEDMSDEDQHELIHLTYRFFIKNMKKNFVNIVINYIDTHKNKISDEVEKKRDVTSITFKTEINDEYDILILSNLTKIINMIMQEIVDLDVIDFLDYCVGDEPILEQEYVKHAYNEMKLTGNFIQQYIDMIDDDFKIEIQSKVRNHILKKYPKRVRKSELIEDLDNNEDTIDTDELDESTETK